MNNNTTKVIDWDRTRELNARRAREAMEDGSYIAGWATVYKREPLEPGGERLTADIKSYGTQLPLEDWLRLHMLDTPVVASEAPAIYAPSAEPILVVASLDGEPDTKPVGPFSEDFIDNLKNPSDAGPLHKKYLELLEQSYRMECKHLGERSRLEYLTDDIFDFTTYDSDISELFATKALEVCQALNNRNTFRYIDDADNYRWYLLMANMPFFADRLEWGTSIRGAWWDHKAYVLDSSGLWEGEQQSGALKMTRDEWLCFTAAMVTFTEDERKSKAMEARDLAVKKGHSNKEAEAFAEFCDKHDRAVASLFRRGWPSAEQEARDE